MQGLIFKVAKGLWANQIPILLQESSTFPACCMDICRNGNKPSIALTKVWSDLKTITGGTFMYVDYSYHVSIVSERQSTI